MKKFCIFLFIILIASRPFDAYGAAIDNKRLSSDAARHASILLRDGRLEEALVEYKKAEALNPDEKLRKIIEEIQSRITKDAENKEAAESLRRQAKLHVSDGYLEVAIEKLQKSLAYYENPDVRYELAKVEGTYKAEMQKQKAAQEVFQIAEQLELRGEYEAALSKLEEAQTVWSLPQILPLRQKIQKGIEKNKSDGMEAAKLAEQAIQLEIRANTGQVDVELLQQALERFRKSYAIVPAPAVEMAIIQTEENILKTSRDIKEAETKAKEARLLEKDGRLEAALEVYNISINLRQNSEVYKELKELEDKINEELAREKRANEQYAEAAKLEANGKINEALSVVNNALGLFKTPEGEALKRRIEIALSEREKRRAQGAELAENARVLRSQNLFPEALDMYWESWAVWPYSTETRDAIDSLESIVKDKRTTEERARKLYNEGLALEGEDRFAEAIERITGSLALIPSKETEEKLSGLKTKFAYKKWLDALLMQPLELKTEPVLPMIGQLAAVRIEGSSWLDTERLAYKWEISGNAKDVKDIEGGKAVNFRASNDTPVIAKLEVYSIEAKGSKNPIMEKKLSIIADSYNVRINVAGMNTTHQKWNPVKKKLEPVGELVTRNDILLRANIYPSIKEAVYEWKLDKETLISGDRGNFEINVRRNAPGLIKAEVTVKGPSGIEIGRTETSFSVTTAYEDVLYDLQRAEAWDLWLTSQKLWAEGKRYEAIRKAAEASILDPSDPDITIGLAKLHNDNARIEEAYYLSAVSSLRKLEERYDDAVLSLKESERLHPDVKKRLLIFSLETRINEKQNRTALAERFRAEGDWLLKQQRKVEAISKYRESLLLQRDERLSAEVLRLTEEVENENETKEKSKELLQKGFSLISKQRYTEATEAFMEALSLQDDEAIKVYTEIIQYRIAEEKELKERASKIREEADSLFKEKKTTEAFTLFHRSLEIWKDEELEVWVDNEEKKYNEAQAAQLRKDAEQMAKRNRREDAIQLYRESLKFAYNKAADDMVKEADARAIRARADELVKEAELLLKQNKPEEALERYKLALGKVPGDQKIMDEIKKLEIILLKAVKEPDDAALSDDVVLSDDTKPEENVVSQDNDEQLIMADKLFKDANELYLQKKYSEALLKYKESYELSKNSKLKEFINRLEKTIEDVGKANSLVRKANDLYKQGKFMEALENYRESLNVYKNPKVEEFIKKVEALIEPKIN